MLDNLISKECNYFNKLIQVCVVVKNIDEAVEKYANIFGWKPVSYETDRFSNIPVNEKLYYNVPEDFTCKAAFYKVGDFEIEMIEPQKGQSTWADFLSTHGEGIHHILFDVNNFEACRQQLEANGIRLAQQATSLRYKNAKWALFDAVEQLGYYIEIFNPSEFSSRNS